jgi:hypothetical protein
MGSQDQWGNWGWGSQKCWGASISSNPWNECWGSQDGGTWDKVLELVITELRVESPACSHHGSLIN